MSVISVNEKNTTATLETLSTAGIPCAPGIQWVPDPDKIEQLRANKAVTIERITYSEGSAVTHAWAKAELGHPDGITLQDGESMRKWDVIQTFGIIVIPVRITNTGGILEFKTFGRFHSTYRRRLDENG